MAVLAESTAGTISIIWKNKYEVEIVREHAHCNNLGRPLFFDLVDYIALVVHAHSYEGPLHHSRRRDCHRNRHDLDLRHSNCHYSTRVLYAGLVVRRDHLDLPVDPLVAGCLQHNLTDVSDYVQEGWMIRMG
jgi:hypothetical protein